MIKVPGAFEIPFAAKEAAARGHFAAVICLGLPDSRRDGAFRVHRVGVLARHHEAAAATGVPMTFGVLTTNSVEEALERAGDGPGNKGWEAAMAAVEMATLQRAIGSRRPTNGINV